MDKLGKFLLSLALVALLALEGYTLFLLIKPNKPKGEKERLIKRPSSEPLYTLTLRADLDFINSLLKEDLFFSYSDGKLFVVLKNREKLKELLNLYQTYREERKKLNAASYAVKKLIKDDLKNVKRKLAKTQKDFNDLYKLLAERGINLSFSPFKEDIKELQGKVFSSYKNFWNKKLRQVLSGYKIFVETPKVETDPLLNKARSFFANELKYRLFKLFLILKLEEAHLAADLVSLKELGNGG